MLETQLRTSVVRWVRGGGLRPVAVVALLAALFVAFPDRNLSLREASAAPSSSPACATGVGVGGTKNAAIASTIGGHGCVVIKFVSSGTFQYETFNYTGADQTWTVPSGVTTATFFLLGAGGGGSDSDYDTTYSGGNGGGGGFASGDYAVSSGQTFTVIVGGAGGGVNPANLGTSTRGAGHSDWATPATFGGGGRGSSITSWAGGYASGGGRSAIRLTGSATDLATAGGGGGAGSTNNSVIGYSNGAPGGGSSGSSAGSENGGAGGTQIAGGNGGVSGWGSAFNGTSGTQFSGGTSYDEGGGGGGGWFGGGGGADTAVIPTRGGYGGGGGSSYVALLTNGSTTAGSGTSPGATLPSTPSTGGLSCSNHNISLTVTTTSNGGTPLVNYEYHIATTGKPASQPTTWTAFDPVQTTSPLTWDLRALGYTSGTFRFYVRAMNGLGVSTGSWLSNSDSSCGVTISASAPDAPTSLSATAGSGSASISFTAGSINGGAITNYEYSLDGITYTALSPADSTSPVTIPGLTGGTTYTVYLKARNSAGLSSASSAVSVTPLAATPTVSGVSGTSGTSAGGTAITITGTNFLSGATVTVGGAACTSVTVVSATSITCTTPAGIAGAQNIVVTNTDTQAATLTGGYTYIAAPSATATPAVATASDSGSSNSDGVTSDNTPTISVGSATNGNTVTVTATKAGSTNVTCTFTATAQSSCDLGTLADGTWSVTSTQTNSGVTSAASSAMSMTIDTTRQTVSSFSSMKTDGTYGVGTAINITATMSETVADGASITVTLDTGDTVVLTKATSTTLTGTYTVGIGDTSSDLTVSSYVLTSAPTDTAGNAMISTSVPSGANNIAGAHAIVVDTAGPTATSAAANSTGGQVTITMSEALHATTAVAGDFAVSVGGVSVVVSSVTVSGSTVVLGLASNVAVGATISVVYTAPSSNSATSNSAIQDSVGNDAAGFTTTAVVPAATTTTTAPASSGGGGGGPASATTTSTTTTTTTAVPTTTTAAPVPATTTTTTAKRRTTTTTAPLRSSSTSTSTSTSSTTSTVVRITTTTIFRPLVPLAPVSTLPSTTTTVAPLKFPPKDLKNDLLVTASVAEARLAAALQSQAGSIEEVKSATLDVAKTKLELLDPKSAIVVAIKNAENRVTTLEKPGASTAQLQAAETRVEELLMALAEMKSISVEKILEAKANLDAVLGDSRATSVEVAAAKAEFADARTPSFEEAKESVGESSLAEPSPVIIDGVVDAPGGNQVVVFDGTRQLNLTVTRVNQTSIQMQGDDGFKLAIAAVDRNGVPFQLNSRGAVIVKHGNFIAVSGEGLAPNTIATTWLFSSPRVLGDLNVDGGGRFFAEFRVDEDVRIGDHVAQVNGVSKDGAKRSVNIDVEILPNLGPPPYDPLSEPRNVVDFTASALVLLTAMGANAARRREREEEQEDDRGSADVADVTVKFGSSKVDVGIDRIKPPRIKLVDDLFFNAPRWTTQVSPMLARVIADASYLRSLVGALWFIAPIFGIVAGVAAAIDTSSDVVMPSLTICLVLMTIGVFDATAGFVAFGVFAIVVAFGGGVSSSDSIRGLLGLAVFMYAVPLAASAVRPFRRLDKDSDDIWNRAVDVVLIALFGAWAAGAMFSALPALTGFKPEYSDEVNAVRIVALIALVVRWLLENAARVATPIRLSEIENDDLPAPSNSQQIFSSILRSFVFVFVAVVFIGNNWALWLGWVFYLVPKLVSLGADKLPDLKPVHRYLPRGIFKVVLMLFVAKWWGGLVAAHVDNPADMIKFGFVLLGIPGLALGAVGWFARSSRPWPSTIVTKLLGTALLIIGVLVVLNIWLAI